MDLRGLRSFCAVAQYGSITKAAEQLRLRQPAVTVHIQELERETGVMLLDRSKRPVQLTAAGGHLAELARPLLRQFDALSVETSSFAQQSTLTVASTSELARNMLVDTMVAYRQAYPDTRLHLRSARMPEVLRMVRERQADLAFAPFIGRFAEFNAETLFTNERALLAAKGHPVLDQPITNLRQIAQWPLIVNTGIRDTPSYLEGKLSEAGLDFNVVMWLDSFDAVKRYVANGVGIAVAPRIILEAKDAETLGIVGLGHLLDIQSVGIVTERDMPMTRQAQLFIEMLRETIPAHLAPQWQ